MRLLSSPEQEVGGGCEAAVTPRTRDGLIEIKECGELPCGKSLPLRLNRSAHRIDVNFLWQCLKVSEGKQNENFEDIEIHDESMKYSS